MTEIHDSFEGRLRYARVVRGWTQDEFAEHVVAAGGKASRTQVHNWERGAQPRAATVQVLASVLRVSPAWLLSGEGDAPGDGSSPVEVEIRDELEALRARLAELEAWRERIEGADASSELERELEAEAQRVEAQRAADATAKPERRRRGRAS